MSLDFITLTRVKGFDAGERVSLLGEDDPKADNITVRHKGGVNRIRKMYIAPLHTSDRPISELLDQSDIWLFSDVERQRLCEYVRVQLRTSHTERLHESMEAYSKAQKQYENVCNQTYLDVMRKASVIGMTTSGAAKYQDVLHNLGARVIVIEEAAGQISFI